MCRHAARYVRRAGHRSACRFVAPSSQGMAASAPSSRLPTTSGRTRRWHKSIIPQRRPRRVVVLLAPFCTRLPLSLFPPLAMRRAARRGQAAVRGGQRAGTLSDDDFQLGEVGTPSRFLTALSIPAAPSRSPWVSLTLALDASVVRKQQYSKELFVAWRQAQWPGAGRGRRRTMRPTPPRR